MNLYREAGKLTQENKAYALATIIESKGSTPRHSGKMIILEDGSIVGTVGGGIAERFVIDAAILAIKEDSSKIVEYKLNSELKDGIPMSCGGNLKVFIEVNERKPKIVLIGGGHVNYAMSKFVDLLDYELVVVDDREEFCNKDRYPSASKLYVNEDIAVAVAQVEIDSNTYIAIATKDGDKSSLYEVISSEAKYIGVIGSKRKVTLLMKDLKEEGIDEERLKFVHSPIGLDIGTETPEEIAISILAEILKVRSGGTGKSFKDLL
ncbi:MAG: XdhC family protein [Acidaminobacteraceae bacterium]